jgi:hypothetical protein
VSVNGADATVVTTKKKGDLPLVPESRGLEETPCSRFSTISPCKRATHEALEAARTGKQHKNMTAIYVIKT